MKQVKSSPFLFNRFLLLAILLIYISISHIFLPAFHKNDFLFFSKWNRMWVTPKKFVYDITWDEGKTFLLRDHIQKAKHKGINTRRLFYVVRHLHKEENKKHFYSQLMDFCKCQKIEVFKLQGSLADHIIYKKQLKIQIREAL